MIADCRKAGLPDPDFEQRGPHFVVTLWREWLTEEVMAGMHLSDRQRRATAFVKAHGRITNKEYRELTSVITRTASRDLDSLVTKGVLSKVGTTGRSTYYVLAGKADKKKTNRT